MDQIIIANDGQRITDTNYFDSEHARNGLCYLTWNAGAGRVLLPDCMTNFLSDMRSARYVIVSRGAWTAQGGRDARELLFEDDSDSPFCLHLDIAQTDRLLPDNEQGSGFVVTVWTRLGEQIRLDAKYRVVTAIPCLEPWLEQ